MSSAENHQLRDEPLDDLLLALEVRRASAVVHVETRDGVAELSVARGTLRSAVFGTRQGTEAIFRVLKVREGSYTLDWISEKPKFSGTLFHASAGKSGAELPPMSGLSMRALLGDRLDGASAPLMIQRLQATSTPVPASQDDQVLALQIMTELRQPKTGLSVMQTCRSRPTEVLRVLRSLLSLGCVRSLSIPPPSTQTPLVPSRRVLITDDSRAPLLSAPSPRATKSPDSPAGSLHDGCSGPFSPAPSAALHEPRTPREQLIPSRKHPLGPQSSFGSTLPSTEETSNSQPPVSSAPPVSPNTSVTVGRIKPAAMSPTIPNKTLPSNVRSPLQVQARDPVQARDSVQPRDSVLGATLGNQNLSAAGGFGATLPSGQALPREVAARVATPHQAVEVSKPVHRTNLGTTSISGTASYLNQVLASPALENQAFASFAVENPKGTVPFGGSTLFGGTGSYRLDAALEPVPSARFEPETLSQLEQLNDAISSSKQPETRVINPPPKGAGGGISLPQGAEVEVDAGVVLPRVGRYEVLARLKSGGMGSVYLCRLSGSAGFERLFAMKVLKTEKQSDTVPLQDFFREARVLASLHHPNVVGIFDAGTPQEPYLVLDYIEGGSLSELLRATPAARNPALVIPILLDALSGLNAAHQAHDNDGNPLHLVHGDVTPHNLLVGSDGACRVADFGIARTDGVNTTPGIARGKPGYLAPEILLGQSVDHRSDLFSMGVVLYSALTGVEPFSGATPEETMQNVLRRTIAPPSSIGFCPPPCFDFVVMKALERNPSDRFSSAEEMMVQLRRVAARQELLATPSEVSAWVCSALEPLLAARRAAVGRRGPAPETRLDSVPSPATAEPHEIQRPLPDVLSNTSMSGPPSSYSWSERTVALPERIAPKSLRRRDVVLSLAVACVILGLLFGLRPDLIPGFLGGNRSAAAGPNRESAPAKAGVKPAATPAAPEGPSSDRIVLPDIEPASTPD